MSEVEQGKSYYTLKEAAEIVGCSAGGMDKRARDGRVDRKWDDARHRWLIPAADILKEKARFAKMRESGELGARSENLKAAWVARSTKAAARKASTAGAAAVNAAAATTLVQTDSAGVAAPPDKLTVILRLTDALAAVKVELTQAKQEAAAATQELTQAQTSLAEAKQIIDDLQRDLDEATKPKGESGDLTSEEVSALKATGLFPEFGK